MGILDIFRGSKEPREEEQKEVAKEVAETIAIDEEINTLIKILKESLKNLKVDIGKNIVGSRGFILNGLVGNMLSNLGKIQGMESISKEDKSVRILMSRFAKISQWLRKRKDFDVVFADNLAKIRDDLYGLEKKLQLEKSILQDEFKKLKREL